MESFAGESFEIVELENALSYWDFVAASDAVDSDYEFEVRSFSSISDSRSLSRSIARSIASEEEDRSIGYGDRVDIGVVEAEIVLHEPEGEDLGVDSGIYTESVVNEVMRSRFSDTTEQEDEDLGLSVDSGVYPKSVVIELVRSRFSNQIEPEDEDLGIDSGFHMENVVNEVLMSRLSDKIEPEDEDLGVDTDLVHNHVHDRDYDRQAHRYSCGLGWGRSWCDCRDDSDDEVYDLDDELVPWSVAGKVGRQRIRKLGKKTSVKTSSLKQLARVKRGCVRGKHELGVK